MVQNVHFRGSLIWNKLPTSLNLAESNQENQKC